MAPSVRLALAQINVTVGDLAGNAAKIASYLTQARRAGADIIAFPEMTLCGYLPEDLLLRPRFVQDNMDALQRVAGACHGITAIVGFVDQQDDLYNAAAVLRDGQIRLIYHKQYLPNYGVFDEARYFKAGSQSPVFIQNGVTFGVNICEDIWHAEGPTVAQAIGGGARVIINITASPYHEGKPRLRERMLATRARENGVLIAYVNQVGGQDEIVFDGGSLLYDPQGRLLARARAFEEEMVVMDVAVDFAPRAQSLDVRRKTAKPAFLHIPVVTLSAKQPARHGPRVAPTIAPPLTRWDAIHRALTLGLSDYVRKNGFQTVVLGLSGGIDSALTATLAADALGSENVVGVFMPSRYTAPESGQDAAALAQNLGIRLITLPIEDVFKPLLALLAPTFAGRAPDVTEENLQARIRGAMLMALSNKFGWLLLATGNKSEMGVGYATLYGDMAGGLAPLKDLWKTSVYALARHRNRAGRPIPARTLRRAPTAELRPNQTDEAALAPYATLDPILAACIEADRDVDEIVKMGFPRPIVTRIVARVARSEFKRKQAPLGIKITSRALGKDRRMPITHRYFEGA